MIVQLLRVRDCSLLHICIFIYVCMYVSTFKYNKKKVQCTVKYTWKAKQFSTEKN